MNRSETLLRVALGLGLIALALGGALGSGHAQAPRAQADAHEHFRAGIEHFNAGRYPEAELRFSLGYELSHKPGFLWNMAESARAGGAHARALVLYRRYVAEAEPDAPRLAEAQAWIGTLEASQTSVASASPLAPSAATAPATPSSQSAVPAQPSWTASDAAVARARDDEPAYEQWWFWAGAGALVAAGVVTAVVLTREEDPSAGVPRGWRVVDFR